MNSNVIWFLTIIISPPFLCFGERETSANDKDNLKFFLDDVILESRRSNAWAALHLSVRRSMVMDVENPHKAKVSWKSKLPNKTAPQIMKAIELREVGSSGPIHLPLLSAKDTSPSVSLKNTPTSGGLTLSFSEDYASGNFLSGEKIMNEPCKLGSPGKHRRVLEKLRHLIQWKANRESDPLNYFPLSYGHGFLKLLQSLRNDKIGSTNEEKSVISSTTVPSQQITKTRIHDFENGLSRHLLKREASTEKPEDLDVKTVRIKDTAEENGTAIVSNEQSTQWTHPVTVKPESEEFMDGMTKSVFITVTSSSLIITISVAAISLYYIRRRRFRMAMDPERQRLIPFRVHTGIYYNQTGPCF